MEQKEINKNQVLELINSVNSGTTSVMLPLKRFYTNNGLKKHIRETSLLWRIRRLFEGLAEYWNVEINEGAILNISVATFKFIKDTKTKLEYDKEKDKIYGVSPINKKNQFYINKNKEGYKVMMCKVSANATKYTTLSVELDKDIIFGLAYDSSTGDYPSFTITFKKNGLLDTIEYDNPVFLSKRWPKEETPFLKTKTTYGKDEYQTTDTLIQDYVKNNINKAYNSEKYLDAANRLIDEVPGFIDIWHQEMFNQQVHQVIGVDNEIIETVFPKLWETADTKEYKTARIRTRKIMDEQNKSFNK